MNAFMESNLTLFDVTLILGSILAVFLVMLVNLSLLARIRRLERALKGKSPRYSRDSAPAPLPEGEVR